MAHIAKELWNWTDTYTIEVADPRDALCALMVVLLRSMQRNARGITIPDKAAHKNTPLFCCARSRIGSFLVREAARRCIKTVQKKQQPTAGCCFVVKRRAVSP